MVPGLSLRRLAREAGLELGRDVHVSVLSMGRTGARKMPADVAAVIEKLTGFVANKRNWPGGFSE